MDEIDVTTCSSILFQNRFLNCIQWNRNQEKNLKPVEIQVKQDSLIGNKTKIKLAQMKNSIDRK
jgi:hypothetical protein